MIINQNGKQWHNLKEIHGQNNKYDFVKNGLLKHLMSNSIINSNNPILKWFLQIIEQSFFFIISYIDYLKDFKKYTKNNR